MGKMLVGAVGLDQEPDLFAFLWAVEDRVQIDKGDPIGCSTTTEFKIELIDDNCTPVCHDVRRCSRKKMLYIDE